MKISIVILLVPVLIFFITLIKPVKRNEKYSIIYMSVIILALLTLIYDYFYQGNINGYFLLVLILMVSISVFKMLRVK